MTIQMAGLGTITGGGGPTVSMVANGDVNSRLGATCYAGVQFNTSGVEYEYTATGAASNSQGNWLDSGLSSQVWVSRSIVSGSFNSIDPGAGRHQLSTTRSFRVVRSTPGIQTCTANFTMFDAASGGNTLQGPTSDSLWSAEYEFDPCPICCFTPETLITTARGLQVPIGSIRVGDEIIVYDPFENEKKVEKVTGVIDRVNRTMYRVTFEDGSYLELSDDHPLRIEGKGPASINPTIEYKEVGIPDVLNVGDFVSTDLPGTHKVIKSIEPISYPGKVYTLENTLFYANGMLVY